MRENSGTALFVGDDLLEARGRRPLRGSAEGALLALRSPVVFALGRLDLDDHALLALPRVDVRPEAADRIGLLEALQVGLHVEALALELLGALLGGLVVPGLAAGAPLP